jgi:hypothetical protein
MHNFEEPFVFFRMAGGISDLNRLLYYLKDDL